MPLLHVPLIGSGKQGDPYRVDLPTWALVAIDTDAMQAVVDVPAADLPPAAAQLKTKSVQLEGQAHQVLNLDAKAVTDWAAHLGERYNREIAASDLATGLVAGPQVK